MADKRLSASRSPDFRATFSRQSRKSLRTRGSHNAPIGMSPNSASADMLIAYGLLGISIACDEFRRARFAGKSHPRGAMIVVDFHRAVGEPLSDGVDAFKSDAYHGSFSRHRAV